MLREDRTYFGNETKKAMQNFGEGHLPREIIRAYGEVKKACLFAIQDYENRWGKEVFESILQATDEVINGFLDSSFPIPFEQGGAGTSINMNMNEVIASRAREILNEKGYAREVIDPIEDINRYQSTNDTFPTAVTVMLYRWLLEIERLVINLQERLIRLENKYGSILITGRTEMQDALPMTLGQIFASWAGAAERDRWRLHKLKERIRTIALGGTAVGSCFFAPQEYIFLAEKYLRQITGLPLSRSQNLTDEISNQDKWAELANGYSLCAQDLFKITGDFLIYTSSFVGEIKHPELQYGSTIMAAKTNPVILEFVHGISISIIHDGEKVCEYSRNGQLQLNAFLPFLAQTMLRICMDLKKAIEAFLDKFLERIDIAHEKIEENLIHSNVLLNTLVPELGYNKVKEIYMAIKNKKPNNLEEYKELIIKHSGIEKEKLDAYFDPFYSTGSMKK